MNELSTIIRNWFIILLIASTTLAQIDMNVKKKHKPMKGHTTTNTLPNRAAADEGSGRTSSFTDGYSDKIQAFQNIEYKGTVSVGTPPQVFEVVIDTGSNIFWLPSVGCQSSGPSVESCLSGEGLYNSSSSETAVNLQTHFGIVYGTGSASGDYFSDQMSFGDANGSHVTVGDVTLGVAKTMTFADTGILGLSFAQTGDPTPVFELAVQRGVFSQPVFSVYLADCDEECDNGGVIKFGGVDIEHCEPAIGKAEVLDQSTYWLFELSGISIKNQVLNQARSLKAIVDTGTSIIAGPFQLIQQIANVFGAHYVQDTYIVPCNAHLQIDFKINGQTYTLRSAELILSRSSANNNDQENCQLAINGDNKLDFIILGSPFIRAYCLLHNVKDRTISFAPVKSNITTVAVDNNNEKAQTIDGRSYTDVPGNRESNNPWPSDNFNGFSWGPTIESPKLPSDPFSWKLPVSIQFPFYPPPVNVDDTWFLENIQPFGWNSNRNLPWTSIWNMPDNRGPVYYNRPYKK